MKEEKINLVLIVKGKVGNNSIVVGNINGCIENGGKTTKMLYRNVHSKGVEHPLLKRHAYYIT